jgi:predicted dehydrogenase
VGSHQSNRRDFLKTTAAASAAGTAFWFSLPNTLAQETRKSPNERPIIGSIGTGDRWNAVGGNAMQLGDIVAVCDVDADHAARGREKVKNTQGRKGADAEIGMFEDYRHVLDNEKIEVVTIVTPDHWHSKLAIEAMKAGKDVYCEKPLTLTIEEGRQIIKVLNETKRVFQVGTQQRSEMDQRFLNAAAIVRDGRIGKVERVTCAIGGSSDSGPIPKADAPRSLNWEKWQGQTPLVDFRFQPGGRWGKSRCHYEFRWWYEYSGGKMTDWGAHHVDIAQWAIGMHESGPTSVEPKMAKHPVTLKDGVPVEDDRYNAATEFHVVCQFPNGVELNIRDNAQDLGFDNGILFEGSEGRFFVNRGKLTGKAVEDLKDNPLPEAVLKSLYNGKSPVGGNAHMHNFIECVKSRGLPVSDVYTHHRAMTTCHLANIAIRLNRTLNWDPQQEKMVGDEAAQSWVRREQRKGYEIQV